MTPRPSRPNATLCASTVLKNGKFWRGNQINQGYTEGEYDFDFDTNTVKVTYGNGADKQTYTASVSSMEGDTGIEVWFEFTSGDFNGKFMKGKLELGPNGAETINAILAFGKADTEQAAVAPATVDAAMAGDGLLSP